MTEHEEFVQELSLHVAEMILQYENHEGVAIAFGVDMEFTSGRTLYIILKEDDQES